MNNEDFKREGLISDDNIRNYNPEESAKDINMSDYTYHSVAEALNYPVKQEITINKTDIQNDTSQQMIMPDTTEIEKPNILIPEVLEPEPTPEPEKTSAEIVDGILANSVNTADLREIRQGLAELQEEENSLTNTNSIEMEKSKQKTLTMINRANRVANRMNNSGFAQGFLFTLLAGFAAGAIFGIGYMVIALGDLTFTI